MAKGRSRWTRWCALTLCLLTASCARPHVGGQPNITDYTNGQCSPPVLRILIYKGAAPVTVGCAGECRIAAITLPDGGLDLPVMVPSPLQAAEDGIQLGDKAFAVSEITFEPKAAEMIAVNRVAYPGSIRTSRTDDGGLLVVNLVDMETYLGGVVAKEMPQSWPPETIKAQMIAARTYALYKKKVRREQAYDLESTTADQVYEGWVKSTEAARSALRETRGVIMLHEEGLFPAYFHSTCGGRTADAVTALASVDAPFLRGVECGGCARSPHYVWTRELTRQQLREYMQQAGTDPGNQFTMQVKTCDDAGTVRSVMITTDTRVMEISAEKFQNACGPKPFKSRRYSIAEAGDRFMIRGKGWGHGVGLCQWGARGLAAQGWRYDNILAHYYGQVELARFY
jgi:stage II sporulation protein D